MVRKALSRYCPFKIEPWELRMCLLQPHFFVSGKYFGNGSHATVPLHKERDLDVPGEFWMFLDDLIEGCQHRGNGVVRRADISLRIAARQLLHQISHGVLPCIATRDQKCRDYSELQCCGSESGTGCFRASRIHIRIRILEYGSGSGSGSFHHQAKIVRKL
jgi:hypothetical protein